MQVTQKADLIRAARTYTLPPGIVFADVLSAFETYHERPVGDDLFLADEKVGVQLVVRSLQRLDLLLYDPYTLQIRLIAAFEPYQGNDKDCLCWNELCWAIAYISELSSDGRAKDFDGLMQLAAIEHFE